jgi:hypothetical protein
MAKINLAGTDLQNMMIDSCIRPSEIEVWSICWFCNRWIAGFILPDDPQKYAYRCTHCGTSGRAFYDDYEVMREAEAAAKNPGKAEK